MLTADASRLPAAYLDEQGRAVAARRARNLRRLRVARGWSQTRLADELGAGATYVTAMEVGRRSITLRTVDQLAVVLGLTPAQVLAELDAPIVAEVAS